jgi:hypothetical protein
MYCCNTYITHFKLEDGTIWSGQEIIAKSFDEAQKYINLNGLNYLTITGKLYFRFFGYDLN